MVFPFSFAYFHFTVWTLLHALCLTFFVLGALSLIVLLYLHIGIKCAGDLLLILELSLNIPDITISEGVRIWHRLQFLVFCDGLLNATLK